ncbi:MAG: GAF domain-containing protein, partial [Rhodospirillaceae bacterium]|nr:GAF domain-containing protein [Rhodospirillaceae bacterium]
MDARAALSELARRTAMLDAISYAAAQIVSVADWRVGIQELLNRLGRATDVSRVTLFEFHRRADGEPVESCRYDWAEPGYARLSDDPRYHDIPLKEPEGQLHDWALARQRGEIVQATLHEVTGETRQTFLEHGTQSFISVPIMLRAGVWGFLGLDDCQEERVWHALEIEVLKTAAALIGGAIERAATDEALRNSRERYALAARGANDGLWDYDAQTNHTWFSPRWKGMLGFEENDIITSPDWHRMVHPEDLARVSAAMRDQFLVGPTGLTGTVVDDVYVEPMFKAFFGGEGLCMGFTAPVKDAEGKTIAVWRNYADWKVVEDMVYA